MQSFTEARFLVCLSRSALLPARTWKRSDRVQRASEHRGCLDPDRRLDSGKPTLTGNCSRMPRDGGDASNSRQNPQVAAAVSTPPPKSVYSVPPFARTPQGRSTVIKSGMSQTGVGGICARAQKAYGHLDGWSSLRTMVTRAMSARTDQPCGPTNRPRAGLGARALRRNLTPPASS